MPAGYEELAGVLSQSETAKYFELIIKVAVYCTTLGLNATINVKPVGGGGGGGGGQGMGWGFDCLCCPWARALN